MKHATSEKTMRSPNRSEFIKKEYCIHKVYPASQNEAKVSLCLKKTQRIKKETKPKRREDSKSEGLANEKGK